MMTVIPGRLIMLQVIFHPGPFKTGTTSIQQYLRRSIGSESPAEIWYPMTTGASPGHVDLFKDLSGRNESHQGMLENWIETAKESNVKTLIISQEDFSLSKPEIFKKIREICEGLELHLVMTHRSFSRRVVSQWQERIKHGEVYPLDEIEAVLELDCFKPTLLDDISESLCPDRVAIVTSGVEESSDTLIHRFIECIGIDEYIAEHGNDIDSDVKINISYGRLEIEFIRHLNIMSRYLNEIGIEHDYAFMRRRLVKMMQDSEWKSKFSKVPLGLPQSMHEQVTGMANEMFSELSSGIQDGRIEVFGNLNHLLE